MDIPDAAHLPKHAITRDGSNSKSKHVIINELIDTRARTLLLYSLEGGGIRKDVLIFSL